MIDWYRLYPDYWFQNYPTSKEWDTVLNTLMDTHPLVVVDMYTVKFGDTEVWIQNYPHAFACRYTRTNVAPVVLPSVKTRKRLRKLQLEAVG
jgi:hypothetical protein